MYIDWDDNYNQLNWFKPSEPPQLLPKDILKGLRVISGDEADRQILNAVTRPTQVTMHSTLGGTSSSWGAIVAWEQTRNPLNRMIESRVTYHRPESDTI